MNRYTELLEKVTKKSGRGANSEVVRSLLAKIANSSNKIIKEHVYKSSISR